MKKEKYNMKKTEHKQKGRIVSFNILNNIFL